MEVKEREYEKNTRL